MPSVVDRPDADLHHHSIYSSQSEPERSAHRFSAAEQVGGMRQRRARWLQTVAEGASLFVAVDLLFFGWRPLLLLLGLVAGGAVGQLWHALRPSDSVCAFLGGAAYLACALAAGGGPFYWLVVATAVVSAVAGLMARQRVRSAFGA